MLAAAVIVVLCWFVVEPVKLPMVADLKPALAVSWVTLCWAYSAS